MSNGGNAYDLLNIKYRGSDYWITQASWPRDKDGVGFLQKKRDAAFKAKPEDEPQITAAYNRILNPEQRASLNKALGIPKGGFANREEADAYLLNLSHESEDEYPVANVMQVIIRKTLRELHAQHRLLGVNVKDKKTGQFQFTMRIVGSEEELAPLQGALNMLYIDSRFLDNTKSAPGKTVLHISSKSFGLFQEEIPSDINWLSLPSTYNPPPAPDCTTESLTQPKAPTPTDHFL